jgi:signal transduction histidine kinase
MEHAYLAGITIAETASQLVLGGICCGLYASARKQVDWLGFGVGCWGLAIGGWSQSTFASSAGANTRSAAMGFTVGTTAAVALIIFSLAWATHSPRLKLLGWLAAVTGTLWQLVLGSFNAFGGAPKALMSRPLESTSSGTPAVLVLGWLLLVYLALLVGAAAVLFARKVEIAAPERWVLATGLGCLALGLCFDGIGGQWSASCPKAFPHAAAVFAGSLAIVLGLRCRGLLLGVRATEQEYQRSLHELAATQATLERVQRELGTKKQLAAVGELAAAIAHEVRNPLAIIMNATAGLRRSTLGSEDRTTLLSILDEEAARLNRLVTDLLSFARPVIIKRSSVSIVELARRAEGRLEDKHRLSISVPDRPGLKYVQADANLLRLVFDNLVSNAFQAMPDGGELQIVVSEESLGDTPFVRIDIIDSGHGMDEQVLARATDPFYTTRPSGTGLGLPIVQRIVEAHGGQIEIQSSVGQGAKVSLFLPAQSFSTPGTGAPRGIPA